MHQHSTNEGQNQQISQANLYSKGNYMDKRLPSLPSSKIHVMSSQSSLSSAKDMEGYKAQMEFEAQQAQIDSIESTGEKKDSIFEKKDDSERIPLALKLSYAAPGFATTSLSFLIAVYATDFYVSIGARLAFLSFFTALARSFDVMTDPLMGWFSDSTRSKHGRRRPYMRIGTVFYMVMFGLLFWPPPFYPNVPGQQTQYIANNATEGDYYYNHIHDKANSTQKQEYGAQNKRASYWFGIFYTLFYFSDTFTNVPYEALGPELSNSPDERSNLFFTQKMFNFLGMLFAAGAPSSIAYILRWYGFSREQIPCDYFYDYRDKSDTHVQQFGLMNKNQLMYKDKETVFGSIQVVNKTSELCVSEGGQFCYEQLYSNKSRYWFEQEVQVIQAQCGGNSSGIVEFEKYTQSSLAVYQQSFVIVAILFGLWHFFTIQNLVRRVKEKPNDQKVIPLVPSILRAMKNAAFQPLLIAWAMDGLGLSALVTMFPFFIRYVVQPDGHKAKQGCCAMDPQVCMGFSVLALLISAMLSSPIWLHLSRKIGKYQSWQLYNVINAFTNILFLWPKEGDPAYTLFVMFINGIPVGGQFLTNAILSDVIDYDEFLNGSRSEGSFSVFATLIPKFVAIPASAIPLGIINMMGFKEPINGVSLEQTQQVTSFIRFTFVLLPFATTVLAIVVKFFFPLKTEKKIKMIAQGIELHKQYKPAKDPLTGEMLKLLHLPNEKAEYQACVLENFTRQQLIKYRNTKNPDVIQNEILFVLWFGVIIDIILIVAVIVTGFVQRWLFDQKKALVSILLVIAAGMMICANCINCLRYLACRQLSEFILDPDHLNVIDLIIQQKEKGQRAGYIFLHNDNIDTIKHKLWQTVAWFKERLSGEKHQSKQFISPQAADVETTT